MNYVIYSPDSFLLMRMFWDLELSGYINSDATWNNYWNPFNGKNYLEVWGKLLQFHSHDCSPTPLINLTEKNYISTLKKLQP